MNTQFVDELKRLLATSDSKLRKHWAKRVLAEQVPVSSFISLLHAEKKTAQRFTWLIGDLLEADSGLIAEFVPMLFSLRDQMPFPGMHRTVGKCLLYCGLPKNMESESIAVLIEWLGNDQFEIGTKHYASKVLFELVKQSAVSSDTLDRLLAQQEKHSNPAHATRMSKMRIKLKKLKELKQTQG